MTKKNNSDSTFHIESTHVPIGTKNLTEENLQLVLDALESMRGKEQFKEQNADAKVFFERAIFKEAGKVELDK